MVTIREVGEGLYGSRWASDLSRDLGLTAGTVTLWSKSGKPLRKSSVLAVRDLISSRIEVLTQLNSRLEKEVEGK